ncbi:hypothetical protein NW762_012433 [Fusarium torreyae]|uniref:Uncharacterized protein n=1 Tax=Fusarium torreyae TaxID=1237075 RepID=A0A9W8RMH9_9HYPO|nr:hypothetical protein NW762_012433 [Fusarium torreyae]
MLPEAIIDCQKGESRPEFEWGQQISKVFTLRELIAKAKWENRDRILELLDQNIERPSGRRTMSGRIYIIVLVFITCSAYFLLLLMI